MRIAHGLAVASICLMAGAAAAQIPPAIVSAVANPARPAADRAADAERKPAETLAFAGIKPGDTVVDWMPGGGYFTQLFCGVVGPAGHVYQMEVQHPPRPGAQPGAQPGVQSGAHPNAMMAMAPSMMMMRKGPPPAAAPICANVTRMTTQLPAFALPQPVDMVWTSRNYHDLHNAGFGSPDMLATDKAVLAALKPGGLFIVLDHAAAPGSGTRDTDTLHRIDPAAVKQEVTAAGFTYVGASDVLRNADDDHTKKVFDPAIKGHTDQFILKFRKPG